MTQKNDMASLLHNAREERAKAEAEVGARVRKTRGAARTEQLGVRITPEHRAKLQQLHDSTGKSFSRIVEDGIDAVEKIERAKRR